MKSEQQSLFSMFLSVYKTKNYTQTYTVTLQTNTNTYITPAATQNTQKTVCPTASLFVYAVFVQQMNYFHYVQKKWNNISSIGDTQRGALTTQ